MQIFRDQGFKPTTISALLKALKTFPQTTKNKTDKSIFFTHNRYHFLPKGTASTSRRLNSATTHHSRSETPPKSIHPHPDLNLPNHNHPENRLKRVRDLRAPDSASDTHRP